MSTPATVVMSQSNGAGEVPTSGITSLSFGTADVPNLVPANHPIVIPSSGFARSFQVFTRWEVTAWVDTNTIDTLKWWKSAGVNVDATWIEKWESSGQAYFTPNRSTNLTLTTWPTNLGGAATLAGTISNPTLGYPGGALYNLMAILLQDTTLPGFKGSHTITFRYNES